MFVEILITLTFIFFQPTIHHFIGNLDDCTASKLCNHTWTPVCGNLEADSSNRLFLDDCDLHEYNCDNNTTYVEVDTQACSAKCTQVNNAHDEPPDETTPLPPSTPPPQPPPPPPLPSAKVRTLQITEETKTETTTTTKKVTETNKEKTETSTNFVASTTTTKMTTEETITTHQISEISEQAPATSQLTETSVISNVNTPTENNTIKQHMINVANDDENTIPEDTTESTTKTTSAATTTKHNGKPDCHPRCFRPTTWETTAVGETRDFVQILRERFGDRIKILRDTTHYPKSPTYVRKRMAFVPGRHKEIRKRRRRFF